MSNHRRGAGRPKAKPERKPGPATRPRADLPAAAGAPEPGYQLSGGAIAIVLDGYDDIFSDFDPRPHARRALSGDFLAVCRKVTRNKSERAVALQLMLPSASRDPSLEDVIRHRLRAYFVKHGEKKRREVLAIKRKGWLWFGLGAACMLVSAWLAAGAHSGGFSLAVGDLLYQLFMVTFEPAGWFFVWEGLVQVLMGAKEDERELAFHRVMARAAIVFSGY